jgi:acetylornithine deacetylase
VLLGAVVDEEWVSAGAEHLVAHYRVDAAILPEQSDLDVIVEHGGFAWFELESRGVESAGIEPDKAVDAIALLAPVLQGLVELDAELALRPAPDYGRPSVHPSTIAGGTQFPAYPGSCLLGIERCTVAGETVADARAEIDALIARAAGADARFDAEVRLVVGREPVKLDADGPLVRALDRSIEARLGRSPRHVGEIGWSDSGIFVEAGIPCAIFGPRGAGNHTAGEYVELDSLVACAEILEATARTFCGVASA